MAGEWLLSLLLIAAPAAATRPPIDECASDPSFATFRDGLRQAVARRDRDALLASVSDDILVNFGGDAGPREFAAAWGLDRPATSELWQELEAVLSLGCARAEDGSFWAPSLYLQRGEVDEDPYFTLVVIRPGAPLHASADAASPIVARLEWDVLQLEADDGADQWLPVTWRDGRRGYVRDSDVRSRFDYRAGFERRGGRWVMTSFVAGD
ncbi:MAG: hypothetical protein M3177_07895 [Pseudomonadota bacterium]|nr:hypothetical protein [Pseudomonadota bacterium]